MKQLIKEWEDHLRTKKKSEATIATYVNAINKGFEGKKLSSYESSIQNYFTNTQQHCSAATITTRIVAYNNFQEWMLKSGHLDPERAVDINWLYKPSKYKKQAVKILTPEQREILFEKGITNTRDKLAILVYLQTGVRDNEFAEFLNNAEHLAYYQNITITGKSASSREIYISDEIKELAYQFIKEYGRDTKIWPDAYTSRDKRLKAIGKKCGLQLNLHMLRSTFATEWVYKGLNISALQQAMGHSSLSQLEPYISQNQLVLKKEWKSYTNGEDHTDVEFLKARIKYLEERLKKYE